MSRDESHETTSDVGTTVTRADAGSTPDVGLLREQSRESLRIESERAAGAAGLSLLVPGLGQFVQRRFSAAAWQFGTVIFFLVAAAGVTDAGTSGRTALILAVLWNVWSAIDAWRFARSDSTPLSSPRNHSAHPE